MKKTVIADEKNTNNPGALKWYLDAERCMRFWTDMGEVILYVA